VLAHSVSAGATRFKKGHCLSTGDLETLKSAGIANIIAAALEPGDLGEDDAARRIADALVSSGIVAKPAATGRVNLHASTSGVFRAERAVVDALNAIDPEITLATLNDLETVTADEMVATVKIIPLAVPSALVGRAVEIARVTPAIRLHPYRPKRVGLIQTELPSIKPSVLDKTRRVTEARLALSASHVTAERRTTHDAAAVAAAIAELKDGTDMLLLFGASAVTDKDDIIPSAIRRAGGVVKRVGMPVDPGNLMVLGELGGKPVIGAPGCARSPKLNGFDWVLQRFIAGIDVSSADIAGMGVGGLLMEIQTRPQPRETPSAASEIAWAILAAGQSARMGGQSKLLARFDGEPLVRRVARMVLAASKNAFIVTGHRAAEIEAALDGLGLRAVRNPDYAAGLSASLKAAIGATPANANGLAIVLADMPDVTANDLRLLAGAFAAHDGHAIVRACAHGKPGNPVILPRAVFAAASALSGDVGARHLIELSGLPVVDIDIGEHAALDVDTPEALSKSGGVLAG
jgi:molybdenum cofactor cytidylyltransferase